MRRHLELSLYVFFGTALFAIACANTDVEECLQQNLNHFHAELMTPGALRRNDSYRVACWWDTELSGPCKSLKLRIVNSRGYDQNFTYMSNYTGIYADFSNAQPRHSKNKTLSCKWENTILRSPSFTIGELLNVTDFACNYIYYGDQKMYCSFSRPSESFEVDEKTEYYLYHSRTTVNCTNTPDNPLVECTLPGGSYKPHVNGTLDFRIVMNDILGKQEQNITLKQLNMIVLPQPGFFAVQNINTNSIYLEWENKNIVNSIEWEVHIMEELERNFTWMPVRTGSKLSEAFNLTGLPHPFREYTLNVSRRLINGTHWSPHFIHKFTTAPDRPSHPPKLWPGGYQYIDEGHQLLVYWQQLELLQRNGPNFTYYVDVRNLNDNAKIQ